MRTTTVDASHPAFRLVICETTPLINWSNQSPADATMKKKASWMVIERISTALYCVRICMEAPMRLNVLQPKACSGLEGKGVGEKTSTWVSLQDKMVATTRARAFKARLAISAAFLGPQYVGKTLTPWHAPLVIKREKSVRN